MNKIVYGNIDNLCIPETKLGELFPNNQFIYQYNQSNILDITENKDSLMVFVKSDIPSSRLNYFKIPSDTLLYLYYTF